MRQPNEDVSRSRIIEDATRAQRIGRAKRPTRDKVREVLYIFGAIVFCIVALKLASSPDQAKRRRFLHYSVQQTDE
jgi:hypothetical protein